MAPRQSPSAERSMSGAIPFAGSASARSTWHREPIDRRTARQRDAPSRRFSPHTSLAAAGAGGPARGLGAGHPPPPPPRRTLRSTLLFPLPPPHPPPPPAPSTP